MPVATFRGRFDHRASIFFQQVNNSGADLYAATYELSFVCRHHQYQ